MVDTVIVSSDISWNMMTPQAGPSNLAYEIEMHVGVDGPVGIARTAPTSRVDRIKSFIAGDERGERRCRRIYLDEEPASRSLMSILIL